MNGLVCVDREWIIPQVRSGCCDAPVLYGDICMSCRDHCGVIAVVICASCGEVVDEKEAEPTKAGLLCEPCAIRRYPVIDHGDSIFPH